ARARVVLRERPAAGCRVGVSPRAAAVASARRPGERPAGSVRPRRQRGPRSPAPGARGGVARAAPLPSLVGMSAHSAARDDAHHSEVSTAYLRQLDEEREAAMRTSSHPGSAFAGAPEQLHEQLERQVAADAQEMVTLMLDLAEHPEVAFEEHRSARAIADHLTARGIEAQVGVHGLATAVRA